MPHNLTTVDHEILTILNLECGRTQGYLADRTGRSRQQVYNRIQVLAASEWVRVIHRPTAAYELIYDPRDEFPLVELDLINSDSESIGTERLRIGKDGVPTDHDYTRSST